jgi:hypothetical protein
MFSDRKPMMLNSMTRLNEDACEKESEVRNNLELENYMLNNYSSYMDNSRQNYMSSLDTLGMLHGPGGDGKGVHVDESTRLRRSEFTREKNKAVKVLQSRPFLSVPYMGPGKTMVVNPDDHSDLIEGHSTREKRSDNTLSEASVMSHFFIPLIPQIKRNIQDPEHYIPTQWVRGGMSTRAVVRNTDYLRECGLKDGDHSF